MELCMVASTPLYEKARLVLHLGGQVLLLVLIQDTEYCIWQK